MRRPSLVDETETQKIAALIAKAEEVLERGKCPFADEKEEVVETIRRGDDHIRALVLGLITVLEKKGVLTRAEVFGEYDKILGTRIRGSGGAGS